MSDRAPQDVLTFTKNTKRGARTYELPQPLAPLFDTHAHLTCFWEKEPHEVLERAARAGVRGIITLFDPVGDHLDARAYLERFDAWVATLDAQAPGAPGDAFGGAAELGARMRFLVGVHPYGAPDYTDDVHRVLGHLLDHPRCVGVGEIGLDYHFDAVDDIEAAPHDVQIACMERQLALAVERDVPVELHLRNDADDPARTAHADAYCVLRKVGIPAAGCVLHCFGEDRATMERFVELGCHIAFGGAATFKRNAPVREAFAACPRERLLFETDCPYMAPEPIRGLECEPAMIAFTVDALCRDRAERTGENPVAVAQAAWDNACRLFRLV